MKKAILTLGIAFAALTVAKAQTNIQVFYDFGKDRKHVTTTVEGFYNDNWGNTFFFVDHDFNNRIDGKLFSPNGTYMEIARCLNFWQNTKMGGLSAHIEYNGGIYNKYAINNAVLAGLFGAKGLTFSGFADFWWQDHLLFTDASGNALANPEVSHVVFISEPQLWYAVGQWFGVPNLNVGGEVELSFDFGSARGFWARPCLGVKWVF